MPLYVLPFEGGASSSINAHDDEGAEILACDTLDGEMQPGAVVRLASEDGSHVVFEATIGEMLASPNAEREGQMTVGKRVQFDDETWSVVNLLRQERRRSFQQLADEAFAALLVKHGVRGGARRRASKGPADVSHLASPGTETRCSGASRSASK